MVSLAKPGSPSRRLGLTQRAVRPRGFGKETATGVVQKNPEGFFERESKGLSAKNRGFFLVNRGFLSSPINIMAWVRAAKGRPSARPVQKQGFLEEQGFWKNNFGSEGYSKTQRVVLSKTPVTKKPRGFFGGTTPKGFRKERYSPICLRLGKYPRLCILSKTPKGVPPKPL